MPADSKAAQKNITSPEQLDQLMTVTSPLGWLALVVAMALIVIVIVWSVYGQIPLQVEGPGILLRPGGLRSVASMTAGRVVDILVKVNDVVEKGQPVARIQNLAQYPMTSTTELTSPYAGLVTQISCHPGSIVQVGDTVLNLGPMVGSLEAVLYLPINTGKKVRIGQTVQVTVSTVDREQYGYVLGVVKSASTYATSLEMMKEALGSDELARLFTSGGAYQTAPIEIKVRLERDLSMVSGYRWSSEHGPPFTLTPGTVCTASIATGSERPIDLVVPYLLKKFGAETQQ